MNTTLLPTTPRIGDMIDLEGETVYAIGAVAGQFTKAGAEIHENISPSKDHGFWLCWTENNTLELGEESEHLECLNDANLGNRVLVFSDGKLCELVEKPNNASNRTSYADNINYYKRMIQQGTHAHNKLTLEEAYKKLGYWEGRFDELTTGGIK